MPDTPNYGLTLTGPHIKRLDVILDEMHSQLSEAWGVNTRQDPQSLLNHLLTNIADQLADLWVFAEDVYYSQYPTSAEGASLDYAVQYGGIVREAAAKSYYRILCTGKDGTVVPAGTLLKTNTNPAVQLTLPEDAMITRSSFNVARIKIAEPGTRFPLEVFLNKLTAYGVVPGELTTDAQKLAMLAEQLNNNPEFSASIDPEDENVIILRANDPTTANSMELSENLTTETVSSIIVFATSEDGNILIPEGVVAKIEKAVAGMESVTNVGGYIAGRNAETDTELRQSYIDKIYNRSSSMAESIRSAILERVQGVSTCSVYENYTNEEDEYGRYPHSVEVVADGDYDGTKLAEVILDTKAGGINTYGSNAIVLAGEYGEPITIRYNRPVPIYVWFKIDVKFNNVSNPPANYVTLIEDKIAEWFNKLQAGDDVVPQRILQSLYDILPGVDYFDIGMASTDDSTVTPAVGAYVERVVNITPRQKAVTDSDWIEVGIINDNNG